MSARAKLIAIALVGIAATLPPLWMFVLEARPDDERFPVRPRYSAADSWYDISARPGFWEWRTSSLDGMRVPVRVFPCPENDRAPLVLLLPDIRLSVDDGRLKRLAEELRDEFHVAIAGTRGQPDARTARGAPVDAKRMTRSLAVSRKIFLDYRAALESLEANAEAMQIEYAGKPCLLAGVFHSNLLLTGELTDLRCQALLSPGEEFYFHKAAELVRTEATPPRPPSLLLVREGLRFRVEATAAALPEAAVYEIDAAGRGVELLLRSQETLATLRRFFRDPDGLIQNLNEEAKARATSGPEFPAAE